MLVTYVGKDVSEREFVFKSSLSLRDGLRKFDECYKETLLELPDFIEKQRYLYANPAVRHTLYVKTK